MPDYLDRILILVAAFILLLVLHFQSAAAQTTTITGVVIDSITSRPLDGAEIYQTDGNSSRSGKDGVFRLRGVARGRAIVLLRRPGYFPQAYTFEISASAAPEVAIGTLRLKPLAVALTPIVIESTMVALNPRLADFYRRRKWGAGHYITPEDIWKRNPQVTSDLLKAIAGVRLNCAFASGCTATSMRSVAGFGPSGARPCPMRVIVDGAPSALALDDIPPAWIAGIEVYKGTASTPIELGQSPCGMVAIWTGPDLRH